MIDDARLWIGSFWVQIFRKPCLLKIKLITGGIFLKH